MDQPEMIMDIAREAFRQNRQLPRGNRNIPFERLISSIVRRRMKIAAVVASEIGKTVHEALLSDILPTLEMLRYLAANADWVLRDRPVKTPMIFRRCRSRILYRPRGVVLVIAPWNNPFQLSMIPVITALAAGNTVILKPSEKTPKTAQLIQDLFDQIGFNNDLFHVAQGGPETGGALIAAGPDMIFFTGNSKTGRIIAAQAAEKLIPAILELGGKDPMVIFEDADLERAARAAVYGAFAHAGQHCVSVKRLYVQKAVSSGFIALLEEQTRALSATDQWGRAGDQRAVDAAKIQIADALKNGASLSWPGDAQKAGTCPTIVTGCSPDMVLMREETFAPVLPVMTFETEEEGIRLANDSLFGLNASVWTRDLKRAGRVARQLLTGNLFVNNVLVNIGNPHLPFGGVKFSGMGRYHGEEGLKAFSVETSVMISNNREPDEPQWFPHDADRMSVTDDLILLRYGRIGFWKGLMKWIDLIKKWKGGRLK